MTLDHFLANLCTAVPGLAPLFAQHMVDYHDALPHVFMGDIARWATAETTADEARVRLFVAFEEGLAADPGAVPELLNVSFLENLDLVDGVPRLFHHFGPRLAAEWARRVTSCRHHAPAP